VHVLFEPGFFASAPVRTALIIGAVTAVVSAVVGVFVVVRSQSFAGHALTDVATTGGSAAFFFGLSPLLGFIGGGVLGAGAMELIGVERERRRDLATGIVLGTALGLAALFLYLDTTNGATTGATQQLLFGSIFTVDPSTVPLVLGLSAFALAIVILINRPLLISSLSAELTRARGINLRGVGVLFMIAMAVSVGLSSIAVGSILSTALLIGPAAASVRLTKRLRASLLLAGALGVAATWLGILFAYDSFYWVPSSQGLPVSFFIVSLIFTSYLITGLPFVRRRLDRSTRAVSADATSPGSIDSLKVGA
jgi:zinc/manganese transport system permease protein